MPNVEEQPRRGSANEAGTARRAAGAAADLDDGTSGTAPVTDTPLADDAAGTADRATPDTAAPAPAAAAAEKAPA
ncbi:MAG: hypothetical protein WCC45_01565, partial [Paeniglutamicibacter sp.]